MAKFQRRPISGSRNMNANVICSVLRFECLETSAACSWRSAFRFVPPVAPPSSPGGWRASLFEAAGITRPRRPCRIRCKMRPRWPRTIPAFAADKHSLVLDDSSYQQPFAGSRPGDASH